MYCICVNMWLLILLSTEEIELHDLSPHPYTGIKINYSRQTEYVQHSLKNQGAPTLPCSPNEAPENVYREQFLQRKGI